MPRGQQRKMQVVAYRSCTGTAMPIVMSTRTFGKVWDMTSLYPKDSLWYQSEDFNQSQRNAKAFEVVHSKDSFDHEAFVELVCSKVDPRTC